MTPEPILWALPVAALCLALGWQPWRGGAEPASGPWGSALALALAGLAGWWGGHGGLPPFPPREAQHWALWGGLGAVLLAGLPAQRPLAVAAGLAGAAVLAVVVLRGALAPYLEHRWSEAEGTWAVAGLASVALATHGGLVLLTSRRGRGPGLPWLVQLACVAAALVVGQSYAAGALLIGSATTAVGGAWVLGLVRRHRRHAAGLAGPWTFLVGGLLLTGVYYAETPGPSALLVLAMPHAAWLPGAGVGGAAGRTALALALGGLAAWLAWPEPSPYAGY